MATGRQQVIEALEAGLPERFRVIPYARKIDAPAVGTVAALVRVDRIVPAAPSWLYECAVILVVPLTAPGPADDELDEALEDVLYAVDASRSARWTQAQRAVYGDEELPAYEVTVLVRLRPDPNQPDPPEEP